MHLSSEPSVPCDREHKCHQADLSYLIDHDNTITSIGVIKVRDNVYNSQFLVLFQRHLLKPLITMVSLM